MLQTSPLGNTDMTITRVGFGAWAIGGGDWFHGWGPQDDDDSVAAIRYAAESGVNWVDTAAIYGLGHSEEVVGRAIRDIPEADRPYVFTKGGLAWDDADRSAAPRRVGDPASVRQQVEDSLRRLGVERIDLYQMHWPVDDSLETYWETFLELKQEGKVRAVGLSNHDTGQLARAEGLGHVDSLQPPLNMIRRDAADNVLPWCAEHDTGAIVYSPMASGLLTGAFSEERAASLDPSDWRSRSDDFRGDGLRRNLALVEDLRPVAERHSVSVAALAVAWTLQFRGITGAIVGARRADQIDGWVVAATMALDEADLDDVSAALKTHSIGSGPTRP